MWRKRGSGSCCSGLTSVEGVTSAITGKDRRQLQKYLTHAKGEIKFVLNVILDFAEASGRFVVAYRYVMKEGFSTTPYLPAKG